MDRREFVKNLALGTGCVVLLPAVTACGGAKDMMKAEPPVAPPPDAPKEMVENAQEAVESGVPMVQPPDWDAVQFNKVRGLAGAIPASYHASITADDGDVKHLGKHLPYVPEVSGELVPPGFIAIMWGDPAKGHAKHPNAAKSADNPDGHWYNWIRVRKAVAEDAEELQSEYPSWPELGEGANGQYAVAGGGEITADGGKNTIYLAALPKDVKAGDTVRIFAHCLTHGEYVDFITI